MFVPRSVAKMSFAPSLCALRIFASDLVLVPEPRTHHLRPIVFVLDSGPLPRIIQGRLIPSPCPRSPGIITSDLVLANQITV